MSSAAYAIGSKTHGTGAQRAYALLSGMEELTPVALLNQL